MSAFIYSYACCAGWLALGLFGVAFFPQDKPADDPAANLIIGQFQKVAGDFHALLENYSARNITIINTDILDSGIRKQYISFRANTEHNVPAALFVPPKAKANGAAVLCLPDFLKCPRDSYSGDSCVYAIELAERGYITLVPDYPGFG